MSASGRRVWVLGLQPEATFAADGVWRQCTGDQTRLNSTSTGKSFFRSSLPRDVLFRTSLLERPFLRQIDTVCSSVNKGTIAV
jgi:hypothetical protein